MTTTQPITLFHSPQTRSSGALALLEELGAPYQLHVLNMKAGEQRGAAYLALNPMGKVPAIDGGSPPERWGMGGVLRVGGGGSGDSRSGLLRLPA